MAHYKTFAFKSLSALSTESTSELCTSDKAFQLISGTVTYDASPPSYISRFIEYSIRIDDKGCTSIANITSISAEETLRLRVERFGDDEWRQKLLSIQKNNDVEDEDGVWEDKVEWENLPGLKGCLDIDFSFTPITNALPIRRLRILDSDPNKSHNISAAWLRMPQFKLERAEQEYTYLGKSGDEHLVRYKSKASGYTADVSVDDDGIVIKYADEWERTKVEMDE
ncbi:uncharacterized protein VTP21DRAFT_5562 [Calcarisporiella thermophila]|uniref:uncharacterized protein n=1 Tax=Calcarisporiella thermophila TaxID=911321 RepID=UPI0037437039